MEELIPTPIDDIRVLAEKFPAIRDLVKKFDLEFEV